MNPQHQPVLIHAVHRRQRQRRLRHQIERQQVRPHPDIERPHAHPEVKISPGIRPGIGTAPAPLRRGVHIHPADPVAVLVPHGPPEMRRRRAGIEIDPVHRRAGHRDTLVVHRREALLRQRLRIHPHRPDPVENSETIIAGPVGVRVGVVSDPAHRDRTIDIHIAQPHAAPRHPPGDLPVRRPHHQ